MRRNDINNTGDHPQSLTEYFESYAVVMLKEFNITLDRFLLESGRDPGEHATRKAEMIKRLVIPLKEVKFLRFLYSRMNSLEQSFLQEVVHSATGRVDPDQVEANYGLVEVDLDSPLSLCVSYGLTPPDLQALFQQFVPKPQKYTASYLEALPETIEDCYETKEVPLITHETEHAALNDLQAILQIVDAGKVRVSIHTGKPGNAAVREIRQILSRGDFYPQELEAESEWDVQMGEVGIRPFAWVMLLQAASLTQMEGNKLKLTQKGKVAMKKPVHETLSYLWKRWLKNKTLHEISRVEAIKGQKSKKRPLAAAPPCREMIDIALSELAEGRWLTTESFFRFMIAEGHQFEVVRNGFGLYLGELNYGNLGHSGITWDLVNGRFTRVLLLEYAATLGLISVALVPPWGALNDYRNLWGVDEKSCLSRYDGLYAIRLNPLGAWILGLQKTYSPSFPKEPLFQVLPNLEINLMGANHTSSDELFLERFSDRSSERTWSLSLPKLLQAVEEGIDMDAIITFLHERNQGILPQPVEVLLSDAKERAGQIWDVGDARLVECKDAILAQLIANDSRLKKLCMSAGEKHLVIPKDKESQFRKNLRKLGYVLKM